MANLSTEPTQYPTAGPGSDSPTLFPTIAPTSMAPTSMAPTLTFIPTSSSSHSGGVNASNDDFAVMHHGSGFIFDYAEVAVTISLSAFLASSLFVYILLRSGIFNSQKRPYDYKGKVVSRISPPIRRGSNRGQREVEEATEETSLLGSQRKGRLQEAIVLGVVHPQQETVKFDERDSSISDAKFEEKFITVMMVGMCMKLHTVEGAREIIMTVMNDELRWEATRVKRDSVKKRYKLKVIDISEVVVGKAGSSFTNNAVDDMCCISIITAKASLHIEAASSLERNCLRRGVGLIKHKAELTDW